VTINLLNISCHQNVQDTINIHDSMHLSRSGVGSPSLYYRYGALRQRCTARPRAAHRYVSVSIAAERSAGGNIKTAGIDMI